MSDPVEFVTSTEAPVAPISTVWSGLYRVLKPSAGVSVTVHSEPTGKSVTTNGVPIEKVPVVE